MIDQVTALIPLSFSAWAWPATAISVALVWLSVWLWRRICIATRLQVRAYEEGRSRTLPVPWTLWPFLLALVLAVGLGELVAVQFLTAWPQNVTPGTAIATILAVGNVLAAGWVFINTGESEIDQLSIPADAGPSDAQ